MIILYAFLIGGAICAIGQFIMDKFKLLPIYVTCLFVVIGAALDLFGIYDKLADFSGMGAMVPISSFGHSVTHGVALGIAEKGFIGIFSGVFSEVSVGIASAIAISFFGALVFKPKG